MFLGPGRLMPASHGAVMPEKMSYKGGEPPAAAGMSGL